MRLKSLSAGRDSPIFGRILSLSGGGKYFFEITSISPSSVPLGAPDTVVQINGGVFDAQSVPYLNGVPAVTYSLFSPSRIDVTIPASMLAVPGTIKIQVRDSVDPGTKFSVSVSFGVEFPVPTFLTHTPAFVYIGAGSTPVAVTGTNFFSPGTYATLDGTTIPFAYTTDTTGTVGIPEAAVNVANAYALSIVNPAPGGGSATRTFNVRYQTPVIGSIAPNMTDTGVGDVLLLATATGDLFYNPADWASGGTVGFIDGVPAVTQWIDATRVVITIPAAVTAVPGTKAITVSNPTAGGGGGTSVAVTLTVGAGLSLDSVTPNTATQHDDPLTITCVGAGFSGTSVVEVDGVPVPTTPGTSTTLTATLTSGQGGILATSGIKAITVVNGALTSNPRAFTVSAWSILNIPNISASWKATDVLTTGSAVTQWNDRTGGVNHLVQATGTAQATLIASDANFNGKPSVNFDGTGDFYTGPNLSALFTTTAFDTVCVYRIDVLASGGNPTTPTSGRGVLAASSGFFGVTANNGPTLFGYTNDGAYKTISHTGILATTPQWFRFRRAAGTNYLSINGGAELSLVAGMTAITGVFRMASVISTGLLDGQIPEAFTVNGAISAADAIRIKNYFANEYGLPA